MRSVVGKKVEEKSPVGNEDDWKWVGRYVSRKVRTGPSRDGPPGSPSTRTDEIKESKTAAAIVPCEVCLGAIYEYDFQSEVIVVAASWHSKSPRPVILRKRVAALPKTSGPLGDRRCS